MQNILISKSVAARALNIAPSRRVVQTAAMFGLELHPAGRRITILPLSEIPLPAPGIVFVTGPSGGGKSTILNLIAQHVNADGNTNAPAPADGDSSQLALAARGFANPHPPRPILRITDPDNTSHFADFADDNDPARSAITVVDVVGRDLREAGYLLSRVGLADAFVMLRHPSELSDGQRTRLQLALLMERADRHPNGAILLIDEFTATLDRMTAKAVARSINRWINTQGCRHTLVCASTHDDIMESLRPDVLVWKGLGEQVEVVPRDGLQRD